MRLAALFFFVTVLFSTIGDAQQLRFIAYGDSRTQPRVHYDITGLIDAEAPNLVLHVGDLWDGYSADEWRGHFTARRNLSNLLNSNNVLVARGNHETVGEVQRFRPPIIRDNHISYSFLAGNVFFVCLGLSPDARYLERELQRPEAQAATFRVIYHHYPIYSAGSHGASGNYDIERVCDQYNVTMSFSGHDHIYERTNVIRGGRVVYSGADIPANQSGTVYVVTGGAGAPLYDAGTEWWTAYSKSTYHYCSLEAYDDRLEMVVKNRQGQVIDQMVRWVANGVDPVEMQSPEPGSVLNSATVTFEWSQGDATHFDLVVGTRGAGSDDIRRSAVFTGASIEVSGIPTDGTTVHVRLWAWNGAWAYRDYEYQTAPCIDTVGYVDAQGYVCTDWLGYDCSVAVEDWGYTQDQEDDIKKNCPQSCGLCTNGDGLMIAPEPGSVLESSNVTFSWARPSDATHFDLIVGTAGPDSNDVRQSRVITENSAAVAGLPTNGGTVYVRLWVWDGEWSLEDYTYQAADDGADDSIMVIGTNEVYEAHGRVISISRPFLSEPGDLLLLAIHRTDDYLPLFMTDWTRVAECFKGGNEYPCSTAAHCTAWSGWFCTDFGGHAGTDLAQTIWYRVVSDLEPDRYTFNLGGEHPSWAIMIALRGAATVDPVRNWNATGCDRQYESVFPSVYGETGDMVILSQSLDDAVGDDRFLAPEGLARIGYYRNSDETAHLFGGILDHTGPTGLMTTTGPGWSACKDALISLTIKPR